jgi:hypothetical protein
MLGKSAYELMEEMSYDEFQKWIEYFERRPPGWRDDNRAMRLLQAQGVKEPGEAIFESLRKLKMYESVTSKTTTVQVEEKPTASQIDGNKFKGSVLFAKMMGAVGGDSIPGIKS